MNRKIIGGLFGVSIILLASVLQLTIGGVNQKSRSSNTLYVDETLYSYFAPDVIPSIDGVLGPGWDAYAYHKDIWLTRNDTLAAGRNADIWIMNDAQYLYIAINFTQYQQDYGDKIWLYFDEDHSHSLSSVSTSTSQYTDDRHRQWRSDDAKEYLLHRHPLIIQSFMWDMFWNGTWVVEAQYGGFIVGPDPTPTGTVDFSVAETYDAGDQEQIVEWQIPLDSLDRFDMNCKSGNMLGLYILIYDADPSYASHPYYMWPRPSTAGVKDTVASQWGDLWTTKVYSASIPHAHDDVTNWRAWLGVQNTGTKESTVVFRFDDYISKETIAAGDATSGYVKDFHGGTNYAGPILIYSDQPFTALLNQRTAASTIMGQTTYVGEN